MQTLTRVSFLCRFVSVVAAALTLFAAFPNHRALAQNLPPGTPPDIQKILQKIKSGGRPTSADIQRLQDWSHQLAGRMNAPGTAGTQFPPPAPHKPRTAQSAQVNQQEGIPCRVHIHVQFTETAKYSHKTGDIQMSAQEVLYPSIGGNGDYRTNMLDPNVGVSSFRFEPYAPGGKPVGSGSGSVSTDLYTQSDHVSVDGSITKVTGGMMFVTTGGDALWPMRGMSGATDGTSANHQNNGETYTEHTTDCLPTEVNVPFVYESTVSLKTGQKAPPPQMHLSYQQMVAAVKSSGAATVTGTESFDVTETGGRLTGSSTVTMTLRPSPLHLLIEPDDEDTYEKWLPMPAADQSGDPALFGNPDPIKILVVFHKGAVPAGSKGPTQPDTDMGGQIDITLQNVSRNTGVCMNYPQNGDDTKPDLYFPQQQPAGIEWVDETHVKTVSQVAVEATVQIAARDTGAYGDVQAECKTLGVEGEDARTQEETLSLPMDDNHNHIADYWEKDAKNAVYAKNLPPDWDDETQPDGMKTTGDGITLFDEYRGFLTDDGSGTESFTRPSPKTKKLFFYLTDKDKDLHEQGAQEYAQATGITVLYLHDQTRLKDDGQGGKPRWLNFNQTPYTEAKQYAVWVEDQDNADIGATPPIQGVSNLTPQCPATCSGVIVSRMAAQAQLETWAHWMPPLSNTVPPSFVRAAATLGLNLNTVGSGLPGRQAALVNELIVFTTMHELGHATGGRHHGVDSMTDNTTEDEKNALWSDGDKACPMRYWHLTADHIELLKFLAGQWDLKTPADGGQWKFCRDDWPNMRIKQ